MKTPIDVIIYMENIKSFYQDNEDLKELLEYCNIDNHERFKKSLIEIMTLTSINNYEVTGNPELSFDQFEESVSEAITDYHIEVMEAAGLIEPILQLNDNELTILYQQTDKAHMHSLINKITLN